MALPKLNTAPLYELAVPSTGQTVSFRPYLVKEEKVLMMAFESGDQKQALKAIVSTIDACVQEKLTVRDLATFDVEYMFTQIRSKSAGEKSTVMLKCKECGKGCPDDREKKLVSTPGAHPWQEDQVKDKMRKQGDRH